MDYSNIFGSQFPNKIIDIGTRKDVDDSVASLINQYYQFMNHNQLEEATQLYHEHEDTLEPYMIDMKYCNRLEEEIYNVCLLALLNTSSVISPSEPYIQDNDSFWYQDY